MGEQVEFFVYGTVVMFLLGVFVGVLIKGLTASGPNGGPFGKDW